MKTISEQELKVILDKHGKWLRNEEGGECADLRFADLSSVNLSYANLSSANLSSVNLSYANLSSANLSYANLSSANLSSADLSFANLRSADLRSTILENKVIMTFQFNRHTATFLSDNKLQIGCHKYDLDHWLSNFETIGQFEGYSVDEIEKYGKFIKGCIKIQKEIK